MLLGIALLSPMFSFGLLGIILGFIGDDFSPLSGFVWGTGLGFVVLAVCGVGMLGWEWVKKEADEGKMRPYMLCGLLVAIAISGWFAWGLGDPTCIEQSDDPVRSSCVDYADDDFEVTAGQRWEEFWSKLPVTLIICLLIAYIAHSGAEKNRPKHFKSEKDEFSVDIFPETISVDLDDDSRHYKYKTSDSTQYAVYVSDLEDEEYSDVRQNLHKSIMSWHKFTVSSVLGIDSGEVECSDGRKQQIPYIYGSYLLKKDIVYYHLTLTRHRKLYELSMYITPLEHEDKSDLDKAFFKFVDSFRFTKK